MLGILSVQKPVKIQVDSGKSGIGAVMLHDDRPIAYASKFLTEAQYISCI